MRFARCLAYGLLATLMAGCGSRYSSMTFPQLPGYARVAVAPATTTALSLPQLDMGRPSGMTFDPSGNLLVLNATAGSLMAVAQRGEVMEKAQNLVDPSAVVASRSGAVYVACRWDGSIVKLTSTEVKRVVLGLKSPKGLAVTSDETLYVTQPTSHEVIEIKPDGSRRTLWHHATLVPEFVTATAKDELFISVKDGNGGRILQLDRQGKQLDEYHFDEPIIGLANDPKGRLFIGAASPADDGVVVGEVGWLDRNGDWTILAENLVRPTAVAVNSDGNPIFVDYDESKQHYEIISVIGETATPWLKGS